MTPELPITGAARSPGLPALHVRAAPLLPPVERLPGQALPARLLVPGGGARREETAGEPDGRPRQVRTYLEKELFFVGCLMPQQHAAVSQGRICSDNCTCCHAETEAADQTSYLI